VAEPKPKASDRDRTTVRRRRGRILYAILAAIGVLIRRLPLSAARGVGVAFGQLGWLVVRRDRRRAFASLAVAFPDKSRREHRRIARGMFHHLGMSVMEILWLPNVNESNMHRTTTVTGIDRIAKLIRNGHGVVVFTAHCGNWEWLAYGAGLTCPNVTVLQRERNEADIGRLIVDTRSRAHVHTIDRGSVGAGREMIQALRHGGLLAFLIDQSLQTESVKVPFFGLPAPTPIGPAKLAVRTESYVASAFVHRENGHQYLTFSEPVPTTRNDDPVALTQRMTEAIEAQIRRHPEQWVWFHERWRERSRQSQRVT
jgi:KDO2-lipid IV(A) lauroyltransferase